MMKRIRLWFRWRYVIAFGWFAYWRLRLAGYEPQEAHDTVLLIFRSSGLVRAKDGGDPWKHMQGDGEEGSKP